MLTTNYRQQVGPAADFLMNEAWLRDHYEVEGLTTRQIAKLIGCGKKAVTSALRRYGIVINPRPNRTPESARSRIRMTGCTVVVVKLYYQYSGGP